MAVLRRRIVRPVVALVLAPAAALALASGGSAPELCSFAADGSGADGQSYENSVSGNGKYVVFRSRGTDLVEGTEGFADRLYLRDRAAGTNTLVSAVEGVPFGGSYNPQITSNGKTVLFQTYHPALPPDTGGFSDLYLMDRRSGRLRLVTIDAEGAPANHHCFMDGNAFTANGKAAVFYSRATNLSADDAGGVQDQIFHIDLRRGTVRLVSRSLSGVGANARSGRPSVSANGRWVVFDSNATDLVEGVEADGSQVYLWDARRGTLLHVSRAHGGGPADGESWGAVVSNAGGVAFLSTASNLLEETDGDEEASDVFVFDPKDDGRISGVTTGHPDPNDVVRVAISSNGSVIAFGSGQDLVAEDTNGENDVYVLDRRKGTLRVVSCNPSGVAADGTSDVAAHGLSANGRWISFLSEATDLDPADTNGDLQDVFVVPAR